MCEDVVLPALKALQKAFLKFQISLEIEFFFGFNDKFFAAPICGSIPSPLHPRLGKKAKC